MFRSADFPRLISNGRTQSGAPVVFPVAFIGFMGAGKTTLARELGQAMGMTALDLDDLIEERLGMKISDIFSHQGETAFREAEAKLLHEILCIQAPLAKSPLVVATGGGIIGKPENRFLLKERSVTVFLDPPFETLMSRITSSSSRPLAFEKKPDEVRIIWAGRLPSYRQTAHLTLSGIHPLPDLVELVLSYLRTAPH